jgi:Kef-type K+ transport system membrane component KefB
MKLLPKLSNKIDKLPISQGLMAFILIVALFYAWTAEILGGMAAITGAFLAGLIFARSPLKDRIESGVSTLAYSFFVPIFFVNVGLSANARVLTRESLWLLLAMIGVAVISKVIGSGLGARIGGFSNLESLQLGAGMVSRGEVGLIVASVGIAEGLIPPDIFAVIVGVVIVTTLLTPAMLRSMFARKSAEIV